MRRSSENSDRPASFVPPTAEQARRRLEEHAPVPPSPWRAWAPLLAVGAAVVLALLMPGAIAAWLPWLALGLVLLFSAQRIRRRRELEQRMRTVQEQAMRRDYPTALRNVWRLLPEAKFEPALHGRCVVLLAQLLGQTRAYEAALIVYDDLIEKALPDDPARDLVRLQRAVTLLHTDRLADADETLRKLRGAAREASGTIFAAAWRMGRIIQDVFTHHFEDLADTSDALVEELRPLGVDAGYGYGLVAWAHYQRGSREQAVRWWSRALCLLPREALRYRFPELDWSKMDRELPPEARDAPSSDEFMDPPSEGSSTPSGASPSRSRTQTPPPASPHASTSSVSSFSSAWPTRSCASALQSLSVVSVDPDAGRTMVVGFAAEMNSPSVVRRWSRRSSRSRAGASSHVA